MTLPQWETWCLAAMALVTVLRLPAAVRLPAQRGLWLAMGAAAVSMSFHLGAVAGLVERLVGASGWTDLFRHLCGLVSVVLILDLALAITDQRRRVRARYLAAAALLTLVALSVIIGTEARNNLVNASLSTAWAARTYWWILLGSHLSLNISYLVLCVRHSAEVALPQLRAALRVLGGATFLGGCYMAASMVYLVGRWEPALVVLPAIGAAQAACLATAAAMPLVHSVRVAVGELVALRRIRPLWRELVRAIPEVELSPARAQDRFSVHTRLYRRVIEIRDALLIVGEYLAPESAARIADHLAVWSVPAAARDATFAACAIQGGLVARLSEVAVADGADRNAFSHSGADLSDEVRWLRSVARAGRSAVVRAYRDEWVVHTG